jgi:DNA mismatch endonuclease, patch repair protein
MKTSERMSKVGHANTPIEIHLRKAVWQLGGRYRLHLSGVPGRPDFGSRVRKVAVFVDGCFWHGCPTCYVQPLQNPTFWKEKLAYNRRRRAAVLHELRSDHWTVVQVWGHDIASRKIAARIARLLLGPRESTPFRASPPR